MQTQLPPSPGKPHLNQLNPADIIADTAIRNQGLAVLHPLDFLPGNAIPKREDSAVVGATNSERLPVHI